jgi:hypothetical protein
MPYRTKAQQLKPLAVDGVWVYTGTGLVRVDHDG